MCAVFTEARLQSRRLVLRPPTLADAGWIADRINDPDIARMTVRVPHPYRMEDAAGFLEHVAGANAARERAFVIERRGGEPVGVLGFHEQATTWSPTGAALGPEIGYWLARDAWGEDLATEATQAALDWAQRVRGLRAVAAGHFADNPASGRVLEKAGFLYTGEVQHRPSVARGEPVPTRMMVWLA